MSDEQVTQEDEKIGELGILAEAEEKFIEKFDAAFDAVNDDSDDTDEVVEDDDAESDDEDTDDSSSDDEDADGTEDDAESSDVEEETEDDTDIDPELLRAAEWAGMKDEALALYKEDPDKAMAMLKKVHTKQNALSQQYAEAGRQRLETAKQVAQQQTIVAKPLVKSDIDWVKTKKIYEDMGLDEEQAEELIAPMRATVEAANERASSAEQSASQYAEQQVRQTLFQQVSDFFSSDRLKPYEKLYGKGFDAKAVSENQRKLLDNAVMIRAGYAATVGQEMPLATALEQAHSLVSSEYLAQAEREKLKGSVKKRRNGSTQKPTHGQRGGVIKDKLGMPQEFHDKFAKAMRQI
jgi:hypothetical protein